jgi:hypothetical protein
MAQKEWRAKCRYIGTDRGPQPHANEPATKADSIESFFSSITRYLARAHEWRNASREERRMFAAVANVLRKDTERMAVSENLAAHLSARDFRVVPHLEEPGSFHSSRRYQNGKELPPIDIKEQLPTYEKLRIMMHEFVHYITTRDKIIGFIDTSPIPDAQRPRQDGDINKPRAARLIPRNDSLWRGLSEGLTEHYTRFLLETYIDDIVAITKIDKEKFLRYLAWIDVGRNADRGAYNAQVQTVDDVIILIAKNEHVPESKIRDEAYALLFGNLTPKQQFAFARRVEDACGKGTLRLLESMKAPHDELGISHKEANDSAPHLLVSDSAPFKDEDLFIHNFDGAGLDTMHALRFIQTRCINPMSALAHKSTFPTQEDMEKAFKIRSALSRFLSERFGRYVSEFYAPIGINIAVLKKYTPHEQFVIQKVIKSFAQAEAFMLFGKAYKFDRLDHMDSFESQLASMTKENMSGFASALMRYEKISNEHSQQFGTSLENMIDTLNKKVQQLRKKFNDRAASL